MTSRTVSHKTVPSDGVLALPPVLIVRPGRIGGNRFGSRTGPSAPADSGYRMWLTGHPKPRLHRQEAQSAGLGFG